MAHYIDKDALVAEIDKLKDEALEYEDKSRWFLAAALKKRIDTLEVKEVDLMIHTIIAECCDWLAMNTNLSHTQIEGCRNLMLNVKEEQYKAQKGE